MTSHPHQFVWVLTRLGMPALQGSHDQFRIRLGDVIEMIGYAPRNIASLVGMQDIE